MKKQSQLAVNPYLSYINALPLRFRLPNNYPRPAWMSLVMTKHVERLFKADPITRSCIELINRLYKTIEPSVHQGQYWSINTYEHSFGCLIFTEYSDNLEDTFGIKDGVNLSFNSNDFTRPEDDVRERFPKVILIVYQDTLYLEAELPINHPLRIFPIMDIGWDFERNEMRPDY